MSQQKKRRCRSPGCEYYTDEDNVYCERHAGSLRLVKNNSEPDGDRVVIVGTNTWRGRDPNAR